MGLVAACLSQARQVWLRNNTTQTLVVVEQGTGMIGGHEETRSVEVSVPAKSTMFVSDNSPGRRGSMFVLTLECRELHRIALTDHMNTLIIIGDEVEVTHALPFDVDEPPMAQRSLRCIEGP